MTARSSVNINWLRQRRVGQYARLSARSPVITLSMSRHYSGVVNTYVNTGAPAVTLRSLRRHCAVTLLLIVASQSGYAIRHIASLLVAGYQYGGHRHYWLRLNVIIIEIMTYVGESYAVNGAFGYGITGCRWFNIPTVRVIGTDIASSSAFMFVTTSQPLSMTRLSRRTDDTIASGLYRLALLGAALSWRREEREGGC